MISFSGFNRFLDCEACEVKRHIKDYPNFVSSFFIQKAGSLHRNCVRGIESNSEQTYVRLLAILRYIPQIKTFFFFYLKLKEKKYNVVSFFCLVSRNPLLHAEEIYKWTSEGRKFFKNCDYAHAKAGEIVKARRKALQDDVSTTSTWLRRYRSFLS